MWRGNLFRGGGGGGAPLVLKKGLEGVKMG